MNRSHALAAITLLLAAPALSGCMALPGGSPLTLPDGFPSDAGWAERALPFGEGHDHADRAHHLNLTTPNFRVIAHEPLISRAYGTTAGGHLCGDAQATTDGRRLAAVESREKDVAFAVADVTDPAAPRWLGEFLMPTTRIYDLAVVPDGKHVVLVTSEAHPPDRVPAGAPALGWRTPCATGPVPVRWTEGSDPVPRPQGLLLVSIENPSDPVLVDHKPLPGHGHGVFSTFLDGKYWVLAASVQRFRVSNTPLQTVTAHGLFQFYEVAGGKLEHVSTFSPPRDPIDRESDPLLVGHGDGWIAKHPGTGQTLAYLVQWDLGVFIVDLDDPNNPRLVGRWNDWAPEREGYAGNLHSVHPLPVLWEGRHYAVVGPEFGGRSEDFPTGIVWVLDTTDPANPFEVAAWTLPVNVEWSGQYMFSNHYLTVVDRTLFVSMYHGGVWAIDLSDVGKRDFALLPSIGVFIPTNASPKPPEEPVRWAPTTEEVLSFEDGTLLTFDSNSGLYTFRFDASLPAPPPGPWPIEPVRSRNR